MWQPQPNVDSTTKLKLPAAAQEEGKFMRLLMKVGDLAVFFCCCVLHCLWNNSCCRHCHAGWQPEVADSWSNPLCGRGWSSCC